MTFTLDATQTVTVYLETDCGTSQGAGSAAFDCAQLESGSVANDYNILEDGSFELTTETLPYQWKNLDNSTIQVKDKRVEGGVDGNWSYRITGQPGKDKYLKVTVPLGSAKASYTLSGWIRADSTPARSGRDFKVVAYHEEEDDDGDTIRYTAEQKLNTFSEG